MGRKKGQGKAVRNPYCCTVCGLDLPKEPSDWGLSWLDETGVCSSCLTSLRAKFPKKRKASHDLPRTLEDN